jgi:hypothetical protein
MNISPRVRRLACLAALFTSAASSGNLSAAIVWNFVTTDLQNTISGQLTTDGSVADLSGSKLFSVVSIDSIHLDGNPVSFTADLPMTDVVGSVFSWNGSAVAGDIFINGFTINSDQLEIDINFTLGNFNSRIVSSGDNIQFQPSFTEITPVPEPAVYGGVFGVGMLLWVWRRRHLGAVAA